MAETELAAPICWRPTTQDAASVVNIGYTLFLRLAYPAVLATLIRIGIVRMSGAVDLVSFVS
jgi:hypothetical protein